MQDAAVRGLDERKQVKEMKEEMKEITVNELKATMERLAETASALERTVMQMAEQQMAFAVAAESQVGRIVATVETQREAELEQRLAEAQARIAELMAASATSAANQPMGRKTLSASTATMLAKQGVSVDSLEAGAIDGALSSLSIEQRIAVKTELMRAGMLR
jgi:Flp pilus assembly secretin CpaC